MTHKQKYNCQRCGKEIPLNQISGRGRTRKYCKGQCTNEAQRENDLSKKRLRRLTEKMPKLVKEFKDNPEALAELKSVIEEIGRMQQRRDSLYTLTGDNFLKTYHLSSEEYAYSKYDNTPKQWSERELVRLLKRLNEEAE